jgi:hypothetical protein
MITSSAPNLGLVPKLVKKAAKATASGVKKGAKATGKVTVKTAKATAKGVQAVGALALKPLRSKINTLTTRRAKKLAWDRRKSKTPTAAERSEARAWTKRTLSAKGPHGKLLALLAGASPGEAQDTLGAFGIAPGPLGVVEPATIALISASIPALTKLLQDIISAAAKSGAAPVDPATAPASAPAPAAVEHDTAPVPDFVPYEESVTAEEIEEADMAGAFGYFSDGYFGDTLGASPQVGAGIAIGLATLAAGTGIFLAYRR